jgi:hypothetical protein
MANEGIPQGGQYPSKQEINRNIRGAYGGMGNVSDLFVDRRFLYGKQAGRVYADQVNKRDQEQGLQNAGQFYNPKLYPGNLTQEEIDEFGAQSAFARDVVEWDIPTSSTDYSRPRTVAAGYTPDADNPNDGVMTVVFRDGTFYNYYQVSPTEWQSFHASYSKGRPWLNPKNSKQSSDGLFMTKPRGPAGDMQDIAPEIREALYRVARTQQQKVKPKKGRTTQTAALYSGSKANVVREGFMAGIPNRPKAAQPHKSHKAQKAKTITSSPRGNKKAS